MATASNDPNGNVSQPTSRTGNTLVYRRVELEQRADHRIHMGE
jgi:hypothetical protein